MPSSAGGPAPAATPAPSPVDLIERALRDHPNDLATLLQAAELCLRLERPAETSTLLTRAMALAPHRPEPFVFMSRLFRTQGMHADAVELLQRAIGKNPASAELWRAAAKVMTDLHEDEDALAFYDEALRLSPEFKICRHERAALHIGMGHLDRALAEYEIMRAAAPGDPGVLVAWADLHALLGDTVSARNAYTKALGLARERDVIEDRLQRLAITEIVYPLERRALPAAAPAPAAPAAMNIVFFHAEMDEARVPFDKPDYPSMLAAAVLAARRRAPHARVVLLTDERTAVPEHVEFDRVVRRPLDPSQLMYERMRSQRCFLASLDDGSNTVFVDADVVVNRDPAGVFDGSFDIALSWRTGPVEAPFNGGAIFARGSPAALAFFDTMLAAYIALEHCDAIRARFPEGIRGWWGDQLAMAAVVGWNEFARRDSDRMSIAGSVVRFLPQRKYNLVMERTTPLSVPDRLQAYLVHFKGARKKHIWSYIEHVLKIESPAAPAVAQHAAAPDQAADRRYSTYDLGVAPITYDVTYFLALAKNRGVRHIDIVAGPHQGFRDDAWCQKADASEKQFRLWNIVLPACQLAGMTVAMHRDRARAAATPYKMRAVIDEGIAGDIFHASAHARRWVARWLEARGLSRPVVINLRESQWPARNSNMDAWRRFAAETNAVVIPDIDGEVAFGHVFDGLSMDRRLALYEAASVVMGANNGPLALCWLSRSIPYLTFKMVAEHPACTPEFFARQGLPVGAQWPWAGPHQRIIWADDDYATIARVYDAFGAEFSQR